MQVYASFSGVYKPMTHEIGRLPHQLSQQVRPTVHSGLGTNSRLTNGYSNAAISIQHIRSCCAPFVRASVQATIIRQVLFVSYLQVRCQDNLCSRCIYRVILGVRPPISMDALDTCDAGRVPPPCGGDLRSSTLSNLRCQPGKSEKRFITPQKEEPNSSQTDKKRI